MNPAKLGKLGSWTQVNWVSWVLEPAVNLALSVLLLWQQTQQTQLIPGLLLFLTDPAKLGKVDLLTGFIQVS